LFFFALLLLSGAGNQSCHWTSEMQHALLTIDTRAARDFPSPFTHTETLHRTRVVRTVTQIAGASLCVTGEGKSQAARVSMVGRACCISDVQWQLCW